ncbi:MAG: hypothetical protein EPN64_13070 [Burkholderiaceae bacterium]|nr:MAG: hypothetical protein EPN64_13070 [Burkholderiaceae bacterium]
MLVLEQLAQKVVACWESGDLAAAVRELSKQLREIREEREAHEETIATARKTHANDDLEIDDEPMISEGDDGVWVSAWVWVPIEKEERNGQ